MNIEEKVFYGCSSLTSAIIPTSVTTIGSNIFSGCGVLQSLTIPFVGANATATEAGGTTLFGYLFGVDSYDGGNPIQQYYTSSAYTTYCIPSSLKSVTVTGGNILYGAFYGCSNIETITLPASLNSIGDRAFYNCTGLTTCNIPTSVIVVGNSAFYNCSLLSSAINLPNLTTLSDNAFYGCSSLKFISLSNNVSTIGSSAFRNCKSLTDFTMPTGVTKIGSYAFYECTSLDEISIPRGVESIGNDAFYNCSGSIKINYEASNCTAFSSGNGIFYNVGKSGDGISVVIGEYVEKIPAYLFCPYSSVSSAPKITSVTFNGLKCSSIGSYAFAYCTYLTTINIPNSVTSIGSYAFNGCTGISDVVIPNHITSIKNSTFAGCTGLKNITIPIQ